MDTVADDLLRRLRCPTLFWLELIGDAASVPLVLALSPVLKLLDVIAEPRDLHMLRPSASSQVSQLQIHGVGWSDDDVLRLVRVCPSLQSLEVWDAELDSMFLFSLAACSLPDLSSLRIVLDPDSVLSGIVRLLSHFLS